MKESDGQLAYIVKNTAWQEQKLEAPKFVRASQLHYLCQREEYYKSKAYAGGSQVEKVPMTRRLDMAFNLGTHIHSYFQNEVIGPLGFLKGGWECVLCDHKIHDSYFPGICGHEGCKSNAFEYIEYKYFDKQFRLSGHIDGKLCLNRMQYYKDNLEQLKPGEVLVIPDMTEDLVCLEIKSSNDWSYKSILKSQELPPAYRKQACAYQHMSGLKRTLFLYLSVNSKDMFNITYEAEPDLWEEMTTMVESIWHHVDSDTVPPSDTRCCITMKDKRAKECPFARRCFGDS